MREIEPFVGPALQIISIILILVGWGVIKNSSRKIATRGEDYGLYGRFLADLKSIEELGHDFWLGRDEISSNSWAVISNSKIQLIRAYSNELELRGLSPLSNQQIVDLRQALTRDAESKASAEDKTIHQRVRDITNVRLSIQTALAKDLLGSYRPERQ